jgi:hypothetical protein
MISLAMINRYSFDGTGTSIVDSLGGPSATAVWTSLDGSGQIAFNGVNQYVDLPAGLISPLPNLSVEVWFVWHGGSPWQKIVEFGDHDVLNDPTNYLYLTPHAGGSDPLNNTLTVGLRHLTGGEVQLRSGVFTEVDVLTQVVFVADDVSNRLTIYKNGVWLAQRDTDVRLDGISDGVCRLGRSLFPDDPYFNGEILDFRIYDEVVTAEMVQKTYALGPSATFAPP